MTIVQGIIAGGAAAHLHHWMQTESSKIATASTWMPLALQVNHLLLLTAETMKSVGIPLGLFGCGVRAACVLAPMAVCAGLSEKPVVPFSSERLGQFNAVYRAGVVASAVASAVLGNPAYAAASLGMLATTMISNAEVKEVADKVNKLMGAVAFIGYSAQIMASKAMFASVGKLSALIVGGKFFVVDFLSKSEPAHVSDTAVSTDSDRDSCSSWHDSDTRSPSFNYGRSVEEGSSVASVLGETLCRDGAW